MINDQKLGIIWMLNDPLTCFCLEFKTNDFCFKFLRFLWSVKQDIWFTFREFELPFIYGIIQIKIGMNIRILVDIKWETIWPGSDNTKDYSTTTTTTTKQQKTTKTTTTTAKTPPPTTTSTTTTSIPMTSSRWRIQVELDYSSCKTCQILNLT